MLEAINVTLPSGLVVSDLVVVGVGASAEVTVSVDAEAVQFVIELVFSCSETVDRLYRYRRSRPPG